MEKRWCYGKNYVTMKKAIVLYRELWKFDLRKKKTKLDDKKLGHFDL